MIISRGVEKIALSSAAITNPQLVREIADEVGSQSVVVLVVKRKLLSSRYEMWISNGKKSTGICAVEFA